MFLCLCWSVQEAQNQATVLKYKVPEVLQLSDCRSICEQRSKRCHLLRGVAAVMDFPQFMQV